MNYRIVCTNKAAGEYTAHTHIVAVGTGTDPAKADTRWTLDEVLAAMSKGSVFYTEGVNSGKIAYVEPFHCSLCKRTYIRTKADHVTDNNLDNLRSCSWSS